MRVVACVSALELDGPADQLDSSIVLSHLIGDEPEQVQAAGVVGVCAKNLPAELLGIGQSSRLMVPKSLGKYGVERRSCSKLPLLFFRSALLAILDGIELPVRVAIHFPTSFGNAAYSSILRSRLACACVTPA